VVLPSPRSEVPSNLSVSQRRQLCFPRAFCLAFLQDAPHGYVLCMNQPHSYPAKKCLRGVAQQRNHSAPFLQRYIRFHCQVFASLRTRWRRLCSLLTNLNCRRTFRFLVQFLHVARQCSCGDSQAVLLKKMDQHFERVSPFPQQTQLREYRPYNPAHPVRSRLRCGFIRFFLQKRTKLLDIVRREYLRSTTCLILHTLILYHNNRLSVSCVIIY